MSKENRKLKKEKKAIKKAEKKAEKKGSKDPKIDRSDLSTKDGPFST